MVGVAFCAVLRRKQAFGGVFFRTGHSRDTGCNIEVVMEDLRQLECCFLCGTPLFEALQPGIMLCKHEIVCQSCQKQANWTIQCNSCQQTWGYLPPDPNLAQWQANIQLIQSWGANEHTDAYLQQQVQWFTDWRQQKVPLIPALSVQTGTMDSRPQQSSLADLSQLPVRPVGLGLQEVWKCGYCGTGGNEGNRCSSCSRVNFQATACDPLSEDILTLFEPVQDLSQQELRIFGEVKSGPWDCSYCGLRGNLAQRCTKCSRVNFQTVPCDPLSEDILALFDVSTVPQAPPTLSPPEEEDPEPIFDRIPERVKAKAPVDLGDYSAIRAKVELLDLSKQQVSRVGESQIQPWNCCCGKKGNKGQTCDFCHRVNFLQVSRNLVPRAVLAVMEPSMPQHPPPPVQVDRPIRVLPDISAANGKPSPVVPPTFPQSALPANRPALKGAPSARKEEQKQEVSGKEPLLKNTNDEDEAVKKAGNCCCGGCSIV